jgi:uncharacterized protein (TIGR00369 family)
MDPKTKSKITRQFIEAIPFSRALNMKLDEIGNGVAMISMPYDERLIGDAHRGVIHGGAISALMDTCGGAAVVCHPDSPGGTATIDLRIDYMRAATPHSRIIARAECYHITRSVAFVSAVALNEGEEAPIATAKGAFTVDPSSKGKG